MKTQTLPLAAALNLTAYGCLPCFHCSMPRGEQQAIDEVKPVCDLGHNTERGRQCGRFDANEGRR